MDSQYSVYIVCCVDNSYYTGITTDVARRIAEHQSSPRGARYLKGRGPLQLVYSVEAGDRSRASQLEYRIKQLSRRQKKALIDGQISARALLTDQGSEAG